MVTQDFKKAESKKTVTALFAGHLMAIGKVVKLSHELPALDERVIDDTEIGSETVKVTDAITNAVDQLQKIIQEAETSLPDDLSEPFIDILHAQIRMLKSKSTIQAIENEITENKKPAATAIDVALTRKADQFSKQDDPILASKADDLIALRDRLRRNVLGIDHPSLDHLPEDRIIVADSLSPAEAIYLYKKRPLGLLLASGSPSGHVGDLCAGLHIPCAFLLPNSNLFNQIGENDSIILDGLSSNVTVNPTKEECAKAKVLRQQIEARQPLLKVYKNGQDFHSHHHKLSATGTVGVSTEIAELNDLGIQEIGLYRSEAALINGQKPPSASEQIKETYAPILRQWKTNPNYKKRPLTFRTYDLEGDKRPSQNISPEERWAIMEEQIGAIMDASIQNNAPIKIMIPNIRTIEELCHSRALFDAAYEQRKDKMDQKPSFGMTLEIPSMVMPFNLERIREHNNISIQQTPLYWEHMPKLLNSVMPIKYH